MKEAELSIQDQLIDLEQLLLDSTRLPFSSNRLVDEQEALQLLDDLRTNLPVQIKAAIEIIDKKEIIIGQANDYATKLLKDAHKNRQDLLDRSKINEEAIRQAEELTKKTQQKSDKIINQANNLANKAHVENKRKEEKLNHQYINTRKKLKQEINMMLGDLRKKYIVVKRSMIKELKIIKSELIASKKQLVLIQSKINTIYENNNSKGIDLFKTKKLQPMQQGTKSSSLKDIKSFTI